MLPKKSRLPRASFKTGWSETVATPYFSLRRKDNEEKKKRIGVVVGAAVHKNAVKRNFWKRQAREALAVIPNGGGKDILIVVSRKVNQLTKEQFRENILKAATRLAGK